MTLFDKNCWKQRLYQISFIKSRFHKVFSLWEIFSIFSTLQLAIWVLFTTYLQIRNISFLQNTVLKNAHCGNYGIILLPQFFRKFSIKTTFTKELYCKFIWRKFLVLPHTHTVLWNEKFSLRVAQIGRLFWSKSRQISRWRCKIFTFFE